MTIEQITIAYPFGVSHPGSGSSPPANCYLGHIATFCALAGDASPSSISNLPGHRAAISHRPLCSHRITTLIPPSAHRDQCLSVYPLPPSRAARCNADCSQRVPDVCKLHFHPMSSSPRAYCIQYLTSSNHVSVLFPRASLSYFTQVLFQHPNTYPLLLVSYPHTPPHLPSHLSNPQPLQDIMAFTSNNTSNCDFSIEFHAVTAFPSSSSQERSREDPPSPPPQPPPSPVNWSHPLSDLGDMSSDLVRLCDP